jgi:hypothetical protein
MKSLSQRKHSSRSRRKHSRFRRFWKARIIFFKWLAFFWYLITLVFVKFCILRQVILYLSWSVPRLWCYVRRICAWTRYHFISPIVCFICNYIGVVLTVLLPTSLWLRFTTSLPVSLDGLLLTEFPLARLPDHSTLINALLVAIPIAVSVFAKGGYEDWHANDEPVMVRVIYACYRGVVWPKTWLKAVRQRKFVPP